MKLKLQLSYPTVLVETEKCACPATFVWGRLHNVYLTKKFSSKRRNWKFDLILETLRNLRPSRINVNINKQSCIPDVNFEANEVCENLDQRF